MTDCAIDKRDKPPMESVDNFIAELKTLVKTCNSCDCLFDNLIRDQILGVKNKEITKKLCQLRDLTLNSLI